jgi:hypothetical protein
MRAAYLAHRIFLEWIILHVLCESIGYEAPHYVQLYPINVNLCTLEMV